MYSNLAIYSIKQGWCERKMREESLLERLTQIWGVAGYEGTVREAIRTEIEPFADKLWEDAVGNLNGLLHEYRDCIIGRMGIPYREKEINIISIAVDAEMSRINALAGQIGRLSGITAKTVYSPV